MMTATRGHFYLTFPGKQGQANEVILSRKLLSATLEHPQASTIHYSSRGSIVNPIPVNRHRCPSPVSHLAFGVCFLVLSNQYRVLLGSEQGFVLVQLFGLYGDGQHP